MQAPVRDAETCLREVGEELLPALRSAAGGVVEVPLDPQVTGWAW